MDLKRIVLYSLVGAWLLNSAQPISGQSGEQKTTDLSAAKWSVKSASTVKSGELKEWISHAVFEPKAGNKFVIVVLETGLRCPCEFRGGFKPDMFGVLISGGDASTPPKEIRSIALAFGSLEDRDDQIIWNFAHIEGDIVVRLRADFPLVVRAAFTVPENLETFEVWDLSRESKRTLIGRAELQKSSGEKR